MKKCSLLAMLLLAAGSSIAQPVTKEEALNTAHRIEETMNIQDPVMLDRLINVDSMLANVRRKSHALKDPAFNRGFSSSFKENFPSLGKQVLPSIKRGNYRLVRQYEQDGRQHLVFRMFGNGGLNYHDFTLFRAKDSIKASDVFVYLTDESLSTTIANLTDVLGASTGANGKLTEETEAMITISTSSRQKRYAQVKDAYEKLDEKVKHDKALQLLYVMACHQLSDSIYAQALEQYAASFPDASSGYLLRIDFYYLQKDFDKGLAVIKKMEEMIGEDPALDILKGSFYALKDNREESMRLYEKAYQKDPTIALDIRLLLINYERSGDKEKAKDVVATFKKTKYYHEDDFLDLFSKYPDVK